jgi:Photoprotection regulator fluorescence recovery protein
MILGDRTTRDLHWSQGEKKCARAAFDAAVLRECAAILKHVETMLRNSDDPDEIWRVHDFLSEKRHELERKYDYRYSVLIGVFGRLVHQGWLTESDLRGLNAEKLGFIQTTAAMHRQRDAQPVDAPARLLAGARPLANGR